MAFRRGSIVWVNLELGAGSEHTQRRPAAVVSNDGANQSAWQLGNGVVTVVPMTTSQRPALSLLG